MTQFPADPGAYLRTNAWMAAAAMGAAMAVLWLLGNPYVWTGAPAGLLAISLRAWYLRSEELAVLWQIIGSTLTDGHRHVPLSQIETVRAMGSFVQIITKSGDKHLIKYHG